MPLPACASALRDSPWILAPLANLRRPLRSQTLCSLLQSLRAYQVIGNISQTPPPAPPGSPQPAAEETRQAQLGAARRPRPSPRDPASPFLERLRATPESGGPGGFADKYRALRARGEGGESSDDDDDMVV
jgi:hypothetical protein